jgi:uncharacterized membrane protein YcaP (DUF421 family)
LFAMLKSKSSRAARIIEDVPTILVKDGKLDKKIMVSTKVTEYDILKEARQKDIFELSEIKYAILESDGKILIIKNKEG